MALFGRDGNRKELENLARREGRLPPGQSLTLKWPVLHYGGVPVFDPATWDFKISGEVEEPLRLTWEEFRALPQTEVVSDFHCVTRWSRLDNHWRGVLFTDVLKLVKPKPGAQFTLLLAEEGYDPQFGARPLKRLIQQRIENPIATKILSGDFAEGEAIHVDLDKARKDFTFTKRRTPVEAELVS